MNVAIIPARGGSKRIPRKNIREFAGRPVIAHSIRCALESGLFERVIVSTDDETIAQVACACGAETPFVRPAELSGDHTGVAAVVAHAVEYLRGREAALSAVCCISATAPLMFAEDLERGLAVLEANNLAFVLSATTFPYPIFRSFLETPANGLEMFFPKHYRTRSQDLPDALHDAGQFYWGRPLAWLDRTPMFGEHSAVVRIPRWRVQDIDTEDDWKRAEIVWRLLQSADAGE